MNGESGSGDPKSPPPNPAPGDPVDIADFERLTSTPPSAPPAESPQSARTRFQMGFPRNASGTRTDQEPAPAGNHPPADQTPEPETERESEPEPMSPAPAGPQFLPAPPSGPPVEPPSSPPPTAPPFAEPVATSGPAPSFADRSGASLREARMAGGQPSPVPAPALPLPDQTVAPNSDVAMTGPVGKRRSPIAVAALSLFTLGIYRILWHSKVNREASDFDFGIDVHPGESALALVVPWVLGLAVSVVGGLRVAVHFANVLLSFDPVITTLQGGLLIPAILLVPLIEVLLPFSVVAVVMTLERVRLVEARSGLPTDEQIRPSSLVWVELVPLIGGLILIGRTQSRLNAAWERAAARGMGSTWGPHYGR